MLTAERLREVIEYDPATGSFRYLQCFFKSKIGQLAKCTKNTEGYRHFTVDGVMYRCSRLAWLYMTGEWPTNQIDHIDLVKSNDAWQNLRQATRSQNKANSKKRADSLSPYKGVSWVPRHKKWIGKVGFEGKRHHLGYFKSPEDAYAAYLKASSRLHGEFARG